MGALEDRRQNAREAGWDATARWSRESTHAAIEAAIETATRVRITPEIILAADGVSVLGGLGSTAEVLRRVFTAAGFEVVQ